MFRRTLQRYGQTPEATTPYQKAAQAWDERMGGARVQAQNWRLASFGSLGLAILLAGGMIWQSTQSRVVPYVVQVDKFGAVQAIGPAIQDLSRRPMPRSPGIWRASSRMCAELSLDPVVVRRDWLEAYDYATDHGAVFPQSYAQSNDPFKAVGERTVSVQVTSVVRVSDNSFQVKWTEQIFEHDTLAKTEHWTAILSIVTKQPAHRRNPEKKSARALYQWRELVARTRQLSKEHPNESLHPLHCCCRICAVVLSRLRERQWLAIVPAERPALEAGRGRSRSAADRAYRAGRPSRCRCRVSFSPSRVRSRMSASVRQRFASKPPISRRCRSRPAMAMSMPIQIYPYSEGALYRLYAAPQEVSDIALQPGENLTAISAGDTTRWVVGDTTSGSGATKQVHILVKPFAANLRTNLVITTDRRSYHLQLESTDRTYMAAISWTYPQDGLVTEKPECQGRSPPIRQPATFRRSTICISTTRSLATTRRGSLARFRRRHASLYRVSRGARSGRGAAALRRRARRQQRPGELSGTRQLLHRRPALQDRGAAPWPRSSTGRPHQANERSAHSGRERQPTRAVSMMSDAAIQSGPGEPPKLDPESLVLRARPRPVARFKRHVVIGIVGIACDRNFRRHLARTQGDAAAKPASGEELYSIDRKPTADGLAALPSAYDKIKAAARWDRRCRAILDQGSCAREMVLACMAQERRARTTRPAPKNCIKPNLPGRPAKANVFFQAGSSHAGSVDPATAGRWRPAAVRSMPRLLRRVVLPLDPARDPGDAQRKLDFVNAHDDRNIYNPHAIQDPVSPYEVMAGTLISASLITGLDSDLPGLVVAQVTQNIYDSVTGQTLLIPQGSRLDRHL